MVLEKEPAWLVFVVEVIFLEDEATFIYLVICSECVNIMISLRNSVNIL